MSLVMVAGLVQATETAVAAPSPRSRVQKEPVVVGRSMKGTPPRVAMRGPFTGAAPVWPGGVSADVVLPSAAVRASGTAGSVQAGGLPVWVESVAGEGTSLGRVRVESFDRAATRAAGVEGMLLRVSRVDGAAGAGSARITVDYRGFRWAYGGDWASRLRLRALPVCALTSPSAAECQGRDLVTDNRAGGGTASAVLSVGPPAVDVSDVVVAGDGGGMLLALTADASGPAGSFAATSLSPSGAWAAGGPTGDFTWSYQLRMPPGVGGPVPQVGFAYSSAGVDGRMAAGNNQPSWLGEGFDWHPGFVERRYVTCGDDMGTAWPGATNTVKTGD